MLIITYHSRWLHNILRVPCVHDEINDQSRLQSVCVKENSKRPSFTPSSKAYKFNDNAMHAVISTMRPVVKYICFSKSYLYHFNSFTKETFYN